MKTKEQVVGISLIWLLAFVGQSKAQEFSAKELARRALERRAVEALIWGMPAVNYDLMYQAAVRETKGDFNQVIYWSRLPDWKIQTLTPNPDSIYLMPFINTKDVGPMVLEIPPADEVQLSHYSMAQADGGHPDHSTITAHSGNRDRSGRSPGDNFLEEGAWERATELDEEGAERGSELTKEL
jgi:hypothetical protein